MITLSHVSKSFLHNKKAVDDISFEVQQGETLVLLGTSGCGKTTTLRMINRLISPDNGNILINGKNINDQKPEGLRKNIGYVLQNNGLFPHYTVIENISTVPRLLGWDKKRMHTRALALMEKLHLPADTYATAYPAQLSGGQQQRVGLARALAADPPVLLMDEPFGSLDPLTRISVRREFKTLDELNSKTIIIVTHDIEEAFELGSRICIMNEGRILQLGTPSELLFRPSDDFVRSFLDKQRLQLELKSLLLSDIWTYLPDAGNEASKPRLSSGNNCWEALERLAEGPLQATQNGSVKNIGGDALMNAIAAYKNR
ncbi:MAG TPA: ATP-binding cassette domain-containing protein [Chitinophaga sp.]|uniref:ABC transporter ATP-binding protein n=1 Tax=Chitinophaga sp. TaxID=1869181 RepID=UPI002B89F579|nr:ATP-binding cassette domain-containing protein [Chitinophaga sp.]HVI49072.1 ATP-binding cassette domain-containing protein [Chitinophaga sp.]